MPEGVFDEVDFKAFVLAARWQFAKTMPHMPHEYTLRAWHRTQQDLFDAAVRFIRQHGYQRKFGRKTYTYFDVGEHQYWTMGAPVADTILINRAVKP